MEEKAKPANTKVYKGIIIALAVCIVIMGALLVVKTFSSQAPASGMVAAGGISLSEEGSATTVPSGTVYLDSIGGGESASAAESE